MKAITMNDIKTTATTHGSIEVALESSKGKRKEFLLDLSAVLFMICEQMKAAKTLEDQQKVYNKLRQIVAKIQDNANTKSVYYNRMLKYMHDNMPNHKPHFNEEKNLFELTCGKDHAGNRIKFKTPKLQVWFQDDESASKAFTIDEQKEMLMKKVQKAITAAVKADCDISNKALKEMLAKATVAK